MQRADDEDLFRSCIMAMGFGVVINGPDGAIIDSNEAAASLLGVSRDDLVGLTAVHPGWAALRDDSSDLPAHEFPSSVALETGMPVRGVVMAAHTPAGERRWFLVDALPLHDRSGELQGVATILEDITAQRTAEQELARSEERAEHLLDCMTDAYFVVSPEWKFEYVNREAERVLFRTRSEMLGESIWELFADAQGTDFQRHYERAMAGVTVEFEAYYAGLDCWFEVRAHPVSDGIAVYFRDVTERRASALERERLLRSAELAKRELAHAATHDGLTGLPNRRAATEWLDAELARSSGDGGPAVLFVDLDRFKLVNDAHGHAEGDLLLIEAGRRLSRSVPPEVMVARIGGDEFVVGIPRCRSERHARELAEEVLKAFQDPFAVGDRRFVVTATIGIALAAGGATPLTLLSDADAALYRAKDQGRNRYGVFDDEVRDRMVARLHMEADLREVLDRRELLAHYQPVFSTATGEAVGAEALARWPHPELGFMPPDRFIPVAEETGLIIPLGEAMLDHAMRDHDELRERLGADGATLWVNVSARQLDDPAFASRVLARAATLSHPGLLGIEITERVLASTPAAADVLRQIATAGVRIAIDDFGTGYSSFARLARCPVDTIKIDRSFIEPLTATSGQPLVAAIVELAHAIGADACGEGVETTEQLDVLVDLGVDTVSGYLLARPMPLDQIGASEPG